MSECCPDPACSHALFSAAQLEASNLTYSEREIILGVLSRDEEVRRDHEHRVLRLKAELQSLRRKGALRPSSDWDRSSPDCDRVCGRCRVELGRVINRGAYCQSCRLKVCKACREYPFRTPDWVCNVCHKRMEIQAVSGEWMNEFVRRPSRRRDRRVYVPAADIIKRTLRRSWTISNPTPRWSSPRGSQLIRPYSSLPRGQDISKYPSLLSYKIESKAKKELSPKLPRHSPAHRSHSEDVYTEREDLTSDEPDKSFISKIEISTRPRMNPLTKAAVEGKLNPPAVAFEMKAFATPSLEQSCDEELEEVQEKKCEEKRVCFDEPVISKCNRASPKTNAKSKDKSILKRLSLEDDKKTKEEVDNADVDVLEAEMGNSKEDDVFMEQCDIEPYSGTVFRKVTVQKRRQDIRKMPAVDNDESNQPPSLNTENQIEGDDNNGDEMPKKRTQDNVLLYSMIMGVTVRTIYHLLNVLLAFVAILLLRR